MHLDVHATGTALTNNPFALEMRFCGTRQIAVMSSTQEFPGSNLLDSSQLLFQEREWPGSVNVKGVGGRGIMTAIPPGWYPDPGRRDTRRYWDGQAWTSWVNTKAR